MIPATLNIMYKTIALTLVVIIGADAFVSPVATSFSGRAVSQRVRACRVIEHLGPPSLVSEVTSFLALISYYLLLIHHERAKIIIE